MLVRRAARAFSLLAVLPFVAGCPGATAPTGITVRGTVVSLAGAPVDGARVLVPGHAEQLTDAQGDFTVAEVEPPYDLGAVVGASGDEAVAIYLALSTATPTVALAADDTTRAATAQGNLAFFPAADGSVTVGAFCSTEVTGHTFHV